ncbi:MAG: hypothetical protein FWG10_02350 [Eubacteriaceae bacterium]|nr:hypothetical protein [Eubacteriaceae bacterium]
MAKTLHKRAHLEIQTHRKNPIGIVRTSFRENGKTRHMELGRITGVGYDKLKLVQAALQGNVVPTSGFKIVSSREYGASKAILDLAKELGLDKMIYSRTSEHWVKCSLAMVIGRLAYPGSSKFALSHCGAYSALWKICGVDEEGLSVEACCHGPMDKLLARQGKIQKALVDKRLGEGCLVLYDIASSCMEGGFEGSDIVKYGYNRDKKRGKKQVAVSLLCGKGGCPAAVDVFPGNTKDEATVVGKIGELHKKYGIEQVVFVGGSGMVTTAQYEKINHEAVKVVSAPAHAKIKELCGKGVVQPGFFDERPIVEVVEGGMRYCLCKNPAIAEKEGRARQALLDKTKEALDKAVNSTRKGKNSKEARAGRVLGKHKMAKFVVFNGSGDNLTWSFDEKKIEAEKALDGCYAIYTDVDEASMSAVEVVESFKGLASVEKAFRRMEMRPCFHRTDPGIECHVFICMLAYYLMWHMGQRLQPLYAQGGVGGKRKYTFGYVIESLKAIRENVASIEGMPVPVITEPNDEQEFIKFLLENPA